MTITEPRKRPTTPAMRRSRSAASRSAATSTSPRSTWPTGTHQIAIDVFLRALQRDVAWGFFYGIVNFDSVFGTMNHYGNVDMFAGRFNDAYRRAEVDYNENFTHDDLMACFQSILKDWTNEGYDPFAAPMETGQPFGRNKGSNDAAVTRRRVVAKRMVSVPGDEQIRTDESGYLVNRAFADVPQDEPMSSPSRGTRARCAPTTCTPTSRDPTSPGIRRWCRRARSRCTARPRRSSSSR